MHCLVTKIAGVGAVVIAATSLHAQVDVEYIGAVDGRWNVDASWQGGSGPSSADTAVFSSLTQKQDVLNQGNESVAGIRITDTGFAHTFDTVNSSWGLEIGNNGEIAMTSAATLPQTFVTTDDLGYWEPKGNITFRNDSAVDGAHLILDGVFKHRDWWNSDLTVTVTGSNDVELNGPFVRDDRRPPNHDMLLVKTGAGTLYLNGTYTVLDDPNPAGRGSTGAFNAITVTEGTLAGTGLTDAPSVIIESGATLAPGGSPGTLTMQSGVEMQTGSIFQWHYDGTGTSLLDLDGSILTAGQISIDTVGTGMPSTAVLMTNVSGIVGDLSTWTVTGSLAGSEVRYDGNNVYMIPIPEPASVALLGLGGLMMMMRRRGRA